MTKKIEKKAPKLTLIPGPELLDNELTTAMKDSAHQIWLAGLGAFSQAQMKGGKVFEALVKEGITLHQKTQAAAGERLADVTKKVTGVANEVSQRTGQQWDKIESIFEERTARALARLGMPSAKEVLALTQRVAALEAKLGKASPAAKTVPRAATKPATPAARKRTAT